MSDENNPLLKWRDLIDPTRMAEEADLAYFKKEFGPGFEYPEEQLEPDLREELEELKTLYEGGNSFALIHTLAICAECGLIMPEWAAYGFWKGYQKLLKYEARTLDEVFGSHLPKGKSLEAAKKKRKLSMRVYLYVRKLRIEGKPIDEALVDAGEKYAISSSSASDLYYAWKNGLERQKHEK